MAKTENLSELKLTPKEMENTIKRAHENSKSWLIWKDSKSSKRKESGEMSSTKVIINDLDRDRRITFKELNFGDWFISEETNYIYIKLDKMKVLGMHKKGSKEPVEMQYNCISIENSYLFSFSDDSKVTKLSKIEIDIER